MKKSLLFLIVLSAVVIYFACESTTDTEQKNQGGNVTTVSGQIESWTLGIKTLKIEVTSHTQTRNTILTTQIDNTGKFSFTLPSNIADSLLTPADLQLIDTSCHGNVSFPSGLKIAGADFNVYSGDTLIGNLWYSNSSAFHHHGFVLVQLAYANTAGSINGTDTCYSGSIHITFNMNFPSGWSNTAIRVDSAAAYYQWTISSLIPTGLKWYFISGTANQNIINPFKK